MQGRWWYALVLLGGWACGEDNEDQGDPPDVTVADVGVADGMVDPGDDMGASLEALYQAAVDDAAEVEASEVWDGLTAISDDNDALVRDEDGRVLMVSWTSFPGYDAEVGNDAYELAVEVWVTVAPQMQDFCRATGLSGGALDLRLEQLLGLPPGNGKDRVVQLWVPPEALFRPAPDPEIDDSVAQLEFPMGVSEMHRMWVEGLRMSSYGEGGYPWTQLGYTYDWNPGTAVYGLSEFVIERGSVVGVESVTGNAEYCGQ